MPRKKTVKKTKISGKSSSMKDKIVKSNVARVYTQDINKDIKDVKKQVKQAESWMIERRKFIIKLLWVTGLILVLLIFSHFYLV